ncbi:MAG: hypothetical protein ACHQ52_07770 [Candidatus Eisenbacteria bacterium]
MRTIILFVVISLILSVLRRRRTGTGPPVSRPSGLGIPRPSAPPTAPPSAPATPASPAADRRRRNMLERVEQARTQARRRSEAEASNAAAESAYGGRTEIPGGIDPKLLDAGRTPQPTPEPLHPK